MKNKILKTKNIYYFFYPFVVLYTIIIFFKGFSNFNLNLIWNSLYHSDYFINYQSGFIRRGLDGEIIYHIAELTNFNPLIIQKTINLISFTIFIFLIFRIIIKNKVIPLFYYFSTGCLLLYLEYIQYGIRKDHLTIIYFLLILKVYKSKKTETFKHLFLNIICIIATLTHEIFYIVFIIPIFFLFFIDSYRKIYILIPSFAIFSLTIIFKGNELNEQLIIESWERLGVNNIKFNSGIFTNTIYIWKIGLTPKQYIGLFLMLLGNFVFLIVSLSIKIIIDKKNILFIFFQYLICFCLCMVACDFSRWIFFTNISIVLTLAAVQKIKYHSISNRISLKLLLSIFLYFIINTQHIGWSYNVYIKNIPLKLMYNFLTQL